MFDRNEYWKNRQEDNRGQGEKVGRKILEKDPESDNFKPGQHMVRIKGKITMLNRKQARQRSPIRAYTTKGFKGHEVKPTAHDVQLPTFPPHITNHDRHQIGQRRRQRALEARKAQAEAAKAQAK